jgi:hypothetical protein
LAWKFLATFSGTFLPAYASLFSVAKPKHRFRRPAPDEQVVLDQIQIRLLTKEADIERFDRLMAEHHYLKSCTLVGENLRYVAIYRGEWLALISFSAASFNLRFREQFIGWTPEQRRKRLPLVVNNSRLLVLPDCHYPNLPSRMLKLVLNRLSDDWQERWGHPVVLVETFVDPEHFRGTTYKVSGWSELGPTSGFGRCAQDFYEAHDKPKQLWVKELVKGACKKLRSASLPPEWAVVEQAAMPRCTHRVGEIKSLVDELKELPEFRSKAELFYPIAGMVALIVLATFAGVVRGQRDWAAFARTLSHAQLKALGFRKNWKTGRYRCPQATVFFRVLQALDDELLETILLRWQEKILGPANDSTIAIDGKTLRHAGGVELVSSFGVQSGRWLGTIAVADKSNEIPAAQSLLDRQDVEGKLVVLDALHTQDLTAQKIVFEKGGDYVLTVKKNQETLYQTLEKKMQPHSFSPSADGAHAGLSPGA